jgi:hypothetical protein
MVAFSITASSSGLHLVGILIPPTLTSQEDWIVVDIKGGLEGRIPKDKHPDKISPRNVRKVEVFIQSVALFPEDYNIQIARCMNTLLAKL